MKYATGKPKMGGIRPITVEALSELEQIAADLGVLAERYDTVLSRLSFNTVDKMTDDKWIRDFSPVSVSIGLERFIESEKAKLPQTD